MVFSRKAISGREALGPDREQRDAVIFGIVANEQSARLELARGQPQRAQPVQLERSDLGLLGRLAVPRERQRLDIHLTVARVDDVRSQRDLTAIVGNRKSVGEGKRVSDRVTLGGSGI